MSGLRARVKKGRLVLNKPTDLPEGTTMDLVLDDEGDELDEKERKALDAAMARAWKDVRRGAVRPAGEVIAELRRRR